MNLLTNFFYIKIASVKGQRNDFVRFNEYSYDNKIRIKNIFIDALMTS